MPQPSVEAVRDTLAALLRHPEYDRSLRETLWHRFTAWLGELLGRLMTVTASSPGLAWALRAALLLAVALLLARVGYVLWARRPGSLAAGIARRAAANGVADPWGAAETEAAAGRYTRAAELTYEGLLRALATRGMLRLNPAHTAGDYYRDLRSRSAPSAPAFRAFTRDYETAVYGHGRCDGRCYERLRELARPLVEGTGAPRLAAADG